jgi:RNase P/RNase MRP subunit p30
MQEVIFMDKKDLRLIKSEDGIFLKKIKCKNDLSDDCDGYIIDCNGNEKEVRKITDSIRDKNKIIAIEGYDNNFNRRILEKFSINYIVSPEKNMKSDNLKQRDSGINHVLSKIAKQKNVSIVINFSELKNSDMLEQISRISRIIQNIKICRKTGTKINIATFAKNKDEFVSDKDLQNFMLSINSSTQQAKESVVF